jgi:hypothetical protein
MDVPFCELAVLLAHPEELTRLAQRTIALAPHRVETSHHILHEVTRTQALGSIEFQAGRNSKHPIT